MTNILALQHMFEVRKRKKNHERRQTRSGKFMHSFKPNQSTLNTCNV